MRIIDGITDCTGRMSIYTIHSRKKARNNAADFHILIVVSSAWDWYQLWPGLIGGRVRD